ncbi:MAG: hypothetical protein ABIO70_13705 [Pseudomonadota bacterium]
MKRASSSLIRSGLWLALAVSSLNIGGARAACPISAHHADLDRGLRAAEEAFGSLDRRAFGEARAEVIAALPCLADPLWPAEAARVHGLMALDAFLRRDDGEVVVSLQAAVRAEPAFDLPLALFPDGHPLRRALEQARQMAPGTGRPLPIPAMGNVTVDGSPAELAPAERPSILQWLLPPEVLGTAYLLPSDPLPAWGRLPREKIPRPPHPPRPWGLVAASGSAALAGGGAWALAANRQARLLDPASPYEELRSLRAQADALTVGAWLSGAAAVGLGVTAGVRW